MVDYLSNIAEVDYHEYGMNLLKSGTSLEGMSEEDVLFNDYKLFTVDDKNLLIGQFFTMNFEEIREKLDSYVETLDRVAEENHYVLVALYVTDIIQNGSYVIYNKRGEGIMNLAYQKNIEEGHFLEGCVSRKKHVVPLIMEVLEN